MPEKASMMTSMKQPTRHRLRHEMCALILAKCVGLCLLWYVCCYDVVPITTAAQVSQHFFP